jgi:hypothetical protein
MIPCSESEGERREADAEARAERFEAAHDQAWQEIQAATPASAVEVFGWLVGLDHPEAPKLMANALRKLTSHPAWDSAANQAAVCAVRELLRLVADKMAVEILKEIGNE